MIGTEIQNYRITEKIGEGGMATVYKAAHKTLPNTYRAIKVLNPAFSFDPFISAKFLTEARTLASLDHPNIVKIYDYIEQDRQLILIMEYVPGETLDKLIQLKTGPINEERAKILFLQIIDAISYAHKHGLIHRDIKPSNIIIANDGTVKIIDFGIVKILEDEQSPGATKTGTKIGTPIYMSPEQIKAHSVDERTDIYAMGVTLFQMVTGQSPYEHTLSEFDIQTKIVNEPLPKANTIYPVVSDHIQYIIDKATAKKKEERFKNCEELKEAILHPKKITQQQSIHEIKSLSDKTKKKPKLVLIFSIIGGIFIVAFFLNNYIQKTKSDEEYRRGIKFFKDENYTEAIKCFDSAIDCNKDNELAWRNRGRSKYYLKQNEGAIEDLDKAISLNNSDDTALNARGNVKRDLKKYDEAILDFNKAISINSNFWWTYENRALAYLLLDDYQSALNDCNTSISLGDDRAIIYLRRGVAESELKDYKSAIKDYNKVISLDNKYQVAYRLRGIAKADLEKYESAIADYDIAIYLDDKDEDAFIKRSVSNYNLSNLQASLNDINMALKLNNQNGYSFYVRGCIYQKAGLINDACSNYSKAKELGDKSGTEKYETFCNGR